MSSKPAAGINHKEFGVTSEGVNTFLDVALQEVLNINPREQEFTIKMTGKLAMNYNRVQGLCILVAV